MSLRTFSSGGGVQSTAALVLSAQGRIDFPIHLFANVGDDSEHPATLAYVAEVIKPYAAANGIEFVELRRRLRDGTTAPTLLEDTERAGSRSVRIPVRMSNGAPGRRGCTGDYKIKPIARWLKEHGATKDDPAVMAIGFTTDELQRVNPKSDFAHLVKTFPLVDLGLSRGDCERITADAGLPPAPKSSCWFCPFHRPAVWSEMRRDEPVLFKQSVELEALLNERRDTLGKDHVYFTRFAKPLDEAIGEAQTPLFSGAGPAGEFEECDEGVCFT